MSIFKILEDHDLLYLLEICPSILAFGKSSEILSIFKILEDHDLLHLLEICPSILASGKSSEIAKIIKVLEDKSLLHLLEICPTILAQGKASEIAKMIEILEKKDLLSILDFCPSILWMLKAKKLEFVISLFEEKGINLKKLEEKTNLMFIIPTLEEILSKKFDVKDDLFANKLSLYLWLTEQYNKMYTDSQIEFVCQELNISKYDFLKILPNIFHETLEQTLQLRGKIWVGERIPIPKEILHEKASLVLEIAKVATNKIRKIYKNIPFDDLYDWCLSYVIENGGDIFLNCIDDKNIKNILISYLYKSRFTYFGSSVFSKTLEDDLLAKKEYASYDKDASNNLIYYPFLEEEENNLLNAISFYIEQGHQIYSELVSNNLGISLEKLKEMLEIIKEKISSQGLVRK